MTERKKSEHHAANSESFRRLGAFNEVIQDQRGPLSSAMIMGTRHGDWNGCSWIAAYNSLTLLGEETNPADIIRSFEDRGLILRGFFGVGPGALRRYLCSRGYATKRFFSQKKLSAAMRDGDIAVLWGRQRKHMNFHFFVLRKQKDGFDAYNLGPERLDSVDDACKIFRVYVSYLIIRKKDETETENGQAC